LKEELLAMILPIATGVLLYVHIICNALVDAGYGIPWDIGFVNLVTVYPICAITFGVAI